jgi:hypothetical protein
MGTRADFYIGRGLESEWLGSIAWDGYPDGISNEILVSSTEEGYRDRVVSFLNARDDASLPKDGWPWPWEDSHTTDYAYAFDEKVWATRGRGWWPAIEQEPEDDPSDVRCIFPNMKAKQNVTLGKQSGVIVLGAP